MPISCAKGSSGGKGNEGMFIERDKKICAAGVPSSQPKDSVTKNLEWYVLQDEVDALIGDAVKPEQPKATTLPPLRHPTPTDKRFAGPYGDVPLILNPPMKSKFQTIVEDMKATGYNSYWNKPLGKCRDPVPYLPDGYDLFGTTAGKKSPNEGRLYDIVLPKNPVPGDLPPCRAVSYQIDRNYCRPAYDPNRIYGAKTNVDPRGRLMKCCLTDDNVALGTNIARPINTVQANLFFSNVTRLGVCTAPNDNISSVPAGFAFGKPSVAQGTAAQCLSSCELDQNCMFMKICVGHLNTVRKCISKRFVSTFFGKLFLNLKYYDKGNTGWLPKQIVYEFCATKYIRFDPALIEPLLSAWNAFDGNKIEYKTFVHMLNYTQVPPNLPKMRDMPIECVDYRTTYGEMVKPGQEIDWKARAGLPSGRYFDTNYPVTPDGCCKADRAYLPQESDAKACLIPSTFTLLGVSHRDLFAVREPHIVRRVFEATGTRFTDEQFNTIWEAAKKHHPNGYVCYETFGRALEEKENVK